MIRRLLAAALVAGSAVVALGSVGTPASAACPRSSASFGQLVQRADDVFSGTVAGRRRSGTTVTYRIAVDTVYQGSVPTAQVSVDTDARARSCGQPDLARGSDFVFFVRESGGQLTTDRRTGTAPATAAYVQRVERALGAGHPAVAPTPEPATVTFTKVAGHPANLRRIAAPGAALVIVGLLGLLVASVRGRRRA